MLLQKMSNKNFDVYFDFGSSKIRAGAFNKNNIENSFFCESDYFLDQSYLDSNLKKIIFNLEKKTEEYLDEVNLMIDSPEILSISISLSKKLDKSKLTEEDIQFLVQDAKQQILRNYLDLSIIHIIIKNYKVDNTDYFFAPIDKNCNLISIDIIFLCIPKKKIENLKQVFSKFDVSVNQIISSSYAKSISFKNNFPSIKNISFIDIGFYKTSIINYKKNHISFFQILPFGSHHITKDLSKILKIDLKNAEKIKLSFDKSDNDLKEENFSFDLIQEIIFTRVEEILKFSIKAIKLDNNYNPSDELLVVLMGEGSKILNNQFNKKISLIDNYELIKENAASICRAGLNFNISINRQEVLVVPKKQIKTGFFEKLFHFFEEK